MIILYIAISLKDLHHVFFARACLGSDGDYVKTNYFHYFTTAVKDLTDFADGRGYNQYNRGNKK